MEKQLFDFDQAVEIMESFHRVSGLGVTLFAPDIGNERVNILFSRNACNGKCPHSFSCEEDASDLWTPACQRVHCVAAVFADRFGGRYFYQCDEDRIFVAAPIVADGGLAAAMVIGPVHIFEPEESRIEGSDLKPFPVRNPAYVQYLSNLLAASAVCVSDSSQSYLRDIKKVSMEQQRQIHSAISRNKGTVLREYPMKLEDNLMRSIEQGDAVSARAILNEILGTLMTSFLSKGNYTFSERASELITLCGRAALRAGVSSEVVFESTVSYRAELERMKTNEQYSLCLQRYVEHVVFLVSRLKEVEHDSSIYQAVEYIRAHYNKQIGLDDVANEVGFSSAYFSRLFKKKMGVNFSTYINQIRIDAAKNSLLSTNLTVSEISQMSGYEDVSYFTRTFKRFVGVAPGYYRSHRGKIDRSKEHG